MKSIFSLLLLLSTCTVIIAQYGLPLNPDPNKCYVKTITPQEKEVREVKVFTYTEDESMLYPHEVREIQVMPATSHWAYTKYDGCESPNPNDCQVLCFREYDAVYENYYYPIDSTLGNPVWKTISKTVWIVPEGLPVWHAIDCDLKDYVEIPLEFYQDSFSLDKESEYILEDYVYWRIAEYPNVNIELRAHADLITDEESSYQLSYDRARACKEYLMELGLDETQITIVGMGAELPLHTCRMGQMCTHRRRASNSRVEWRVMNVSLRR